MVSLRRVIILLTSVLACIPVWAEATFQLPARYAAQNGTLGVVAGDFNGDGAIDAAVANASSGSITVFLGKGDGSFQAGVNYNAPPGYQPNSLAIGDFKKDGRPDILAVCIGQPEIIVFPGNGDGTFGQAILTEIPLKATAGNYLDGNSAPPAVADFDRDGNLDLVLVVDSTAGPENVATIFKGKGDGTFVQGASLVLGSVIWALVAADFNSDGIPDLAAIADPFDSNNQSLIFLPGKGDGTFGAVQLLYEVASNAHCDSGTNLAAGDVNGDGALDIVIFEGACSPTVTVVRGDGKGNFTKTFAYSGSQNTHLTNPIAFLADTRGSGHLDIVEVLEFLEGQAFTYEIAVMENNGDGTFANPYGVSMPSDSFVTALVAADLNRDGLPDLAIARMPTLQAVFDEGAQKRAGDLPAGGFSVLLNTTQRSPSDFVNVNAASFLNGQQAADSIVTAFGPGFPSSPTVSVRDSAGVSRSAKIFYNSATQINYAIPAATATGPSTVTVSGGGSVLMSSLGIAAVSPAVFYTGANIAVGNVDTIKNGTQTLTSLVKEDVPGQISPAPINVDPGSDQDQVFLILYGTGIRNHKQPVTATFGATTSSASYAGAQGTFIGEDQINIPLPKSLKGNGGTYIVLNVDDQFTNPVWIQIQ